MMKTLQTKIGKNRKSNDKEIEKSKIENEIKHLYEERRIPKKSLSTMKLRVRVSKTE